MMLKYIAILAMVLDHINHIVYDFQYDILTQIGRIAFPLFIYLSVKSYMYYTKDKQNYILRIFIFSLITIPFHTYGFGSLLPLNIFFSITLGLSAIYIIENKYYYFITIPFILSLYVDYSFFSVLSFVAFYYFMLSKTKYSFVLLIASLFLLNAYYQNYYLIVFIPLILIDMFYKIDFRTSLNKYAFYAFYPLHIAFLGLFK